MRLLSQTYFSFLHISIFFFPSKLLFECFLCDRERVCAPATVGQKKESHSKSCVCVWERGNALSHSADGKLLLLWLSPNLHILPSSILPFFLPLSHRLRNRTVERGGEGERKREREGSSKLKRESVGGKKEEEEKKNLVPSCLQPPGLHKPPKDSGTERRTSLTARVPSSHRLLVFNSIPLKKKKER